MDVMLSIAGSDSSAGAGIQADLKTAAALGAFGMTAITAITAQNTKGVQGFELVSPTLIEAQVRSIFDDFAASISSVKSGMLGSAEIVLAVAELMEAFEPQVYVLDPVVCAAGGDLLIEERGVEAVRDRLIPIATLCTPNIHELRALTGRDVDSLDAVVDAARSLVEEHGASAVLVTGGALDASPGTDVLVDGDGAVEKLQGEWIESRNIHGTGCTHSAAMAVLLGRGRSLVEAARGAREYVREAIRCGPELGTGHRPTEHFHVLRRR